MDYDPNDKTRFHHFCRIVELRKRGASWYDIAEVLLTVRRLRGHEAIGDLHESGFEREVTAETGLSKDDMTRMMATYERVLMFADGWHPKNLTCDDMEAVELGVRLAWHDPAEGRRVLLALKDGKISKGAVREMVGRIDGTVSEEHETDPRPIGPR